MKKEIESKLDKISDAWNSYIFKYEFCFKRLKGNSDLRTNYFGDLMGYFDDTLDIAFESVPPNREDYTSTFSFNISFLQSLYIQQDFIEELLIIFKTGITKGDLKKNPDYNENRDLRNELVGHPIRKNKGELISSTLFSYQAKKGVIEYMRYHKENSFNFETKSYNIDDIRRAHFNFLCHYLDKIISSIKKELRVFLKQLNTILNVLKTDSFKQILDVAQNYFEDIFEAEYCFEKETLLHIYEKRDSHPRYQHVIRRFLEYLEESVLETQNDIKIFCEDKKLVPDFIENSPINIIFKKASELLPEELEKAKKVNFNYEIGKLFTERTEQYEFFSNLLKTEFKDDSTILAELYHMESNRFIKGEYYSALKYMSTLIRKQYP
ncbi:hypothetical protein MUK51_18435 [Sphingobacterium faecium]|uniref:hypothetical protein n=1 Tax=Sphingobacterium faecium TaxID=34087 RepID=UPI0021B5E5A1|nr:hypothetical protein [Sphingobacterium faecium]UXD69158.1 hypothetical protein MUK51_18435 [Sphingobacterium faecium]